VGAADPFAQRVIDWQRTHGRHDLPWQQQRDAYRIWLSEVMLQQTQVATALPYYTRFIDEFPTVADLARAPLERVLQLWSGLGYYRRAHHLHAAARTVVGEHNGQFPTDAATLATLPGIGRSTAAAIAAFASDERGAILDGNVKRVLARHRGVDGWPGDPRVQATLWRFAGALLPASSGIRAYTQGLMDLGATLCTRANPRCAACPVAADCVAFNDARTDSLPAPRPRARLPRRAVTMLVLERAGEVLLERRPPVGIWSGLWSLPEVPVGTDIGDYVRSRFGATPGEPQPLRCIDHVFTHFALTMHPVSVPITRWPTTADAPGVAEWFTHEAAIAAALPAPIRTLVRRLSDARDRPEGV
jgi:A/G-specific adenine glycosylase